MTSSAYVLLNLHLHECLRENAYALLQELRITLQLCLAQQLREHILNSSAIVHLLLGSLIHLEYKLYGGRPRQRPWLLTHSGGLYPESDLSSGKEIFRLLCYLPNLIPM